jgi:RimJ/RimL family protein N-acetyltransferase
MFHRSERLFLRPGWIEDAAELAERLSDRAIVRNLARVPWPYSRDAAAEWLARAKPARLPTMLLTLPGAGGSRIIGACGIHEGETGAIELGYWIARDWWGQGFATEGARAMIRLAGLFGHKRIHAYHAHDNPASGRVLRKAGFTPTGTTRKFFSLGRGEEVSAPEFVAELGEGAGDGVPQDMAEAA